MRLAKLNLITVAAFGVLVALAPMSRAQDSQGNARADRPTAAGQQRREARQAGANSFNRIAEQLKLTAEQKSKLQPILRKEAVALRELRQDTALTPEERREKVRTIRDQHLTEMKPILTTEQFGQLKKLREPGAARGARGERPARGDRPARGGQGRGAAGGEGQK